MDEIRNRIKKVMQDFSYTPNALAMAIGVAPTNLSAKMRGKQQFTERDFRKIHDKLGVSLEWLRDGAGNMYERKIVSINQSNKHVKGDAWNICGEMDISVILKELEMLREQNKWLRSLLEKKVIVEN